MPSPNAVFTELVSTTFRNHSKEITNNVSRHTALLNRMKKRGNIKTESGGLTITKPLDYAENATYQRYSGFDVLNVGQSDVISAAEFQWRQIAVNVIASGRELRINSGSNKIVDLVKSRTKNAMRTFNNNFSTDIYSDGSLSNQINGLQALVSDLGTGTVGGINSTTFPFWRSKLQSAAAPIQGGGAITPGATTIESLMLPLWLAQTRNQDAPDLIVADSNYFTFYETSQLSIKRYTNDGSSGDSFTANGGFTTMKYKNADVVYDGSDIPANRMYFLNTDYIEMVAHTDANVTMMDEMKPYNQDGVVMPVLWMGNMVVTNRSLQGIVKA
jgi:hypothetical protein